MRALLLPVATFAGVLGLLYGGDAALQVARRATPKPDTIAAPIAPADVVAPLRKGKPEKPRQLPLLFNPADDRGTTWRAPRSLPRDVASKKATRDETRISVATIKAESAERVARLRAAKPWKRSETTTQSRDKRGNAHTTRQTTIRSF
jgi:hypothetical protein